MTYSRLTPSPRYAELLNMYKSVHTEGIAAQNLTAEDTFSGTSLGPHVKTIQRLIKDTGARTVLDYGAGKGVKYAATNLSIGGTRISSIKDYWGVDGITCYDPAYVPFATMPEGQFDVVVCTDVLEHIPEADLPWILEEQFRYARKAVFGNIAAYPAEKTLPNGENAHCTIQGADWWHETIRKARAAAGSSADYLYLVETKVMRSKWFGLKKKAVRQFEHLTSRPGWESF